MLVDPAGESHLEFFMKVWMLLKRKNPTTGRKCLKICKKKPGRQISTIKIISPPGTVDERNPFPNYLGGETSNIFYVHP